MKRNNLRSFISGVLVTVLTVGLLGTASATLGTRFMDVDYKNLSVQLDGETLALTDANGRTVEPFAYNGTTYLPVRAIANALGLGVDYMETRNPEAGIVILTSPTAASSDEAALDTISVMAFYKILDENLNYLADDYDFLYSEENISDLLVAQNADGSMFMSMIKSDVESCLALAEGHYDACYELLSTDDDALMTEYRRLANQLISTFSQLETYGNQSNFQAIIVASSQNHSDSISASTMARTGFWTTYQNAFS